MRATVVLARMRFHLDSSLFPASGAMFQAHRTVSMLLLYVWLVSGTLASTEVQARTQPQTRNQGWTAHTSFRDVRAVATSADRVWVATTGGVFSYLPETGEITRLTVVDGLSNVDANTIAVDERRDVVWIGYDDGVLDRVSMETGEISSFRDIERASQFSPRGINRIVIFGDSLLVATDFGIVVFDPVRLEVRDSFSRLGDVPAATAVFDIVVADDTGGSQGQQSFWAATTDGVARASVTAANLQDPAQWTNERTGLSSGTGEVHALAFFRGVLYAGAEDDLYERGQGGTYNRLFVTGTGITSLASGPDYLLGTTQFRIVLVRPDGSSSLFSVNGFQRLSMVISEGTASFWLGDQTFGLALAPVPTGSQDVDALITVVPAGPDDGLFSDLDVGPDGSLWAGGINASGSGFHQLDVEGEWHSFTAATRSELLGADRFTRVYATDDGTGWAGSEGDGVASVSPGGELVLYGLDNSSLKPAAGTSDFIIVGGISSDSESTVWVTTRGSSVPLHARTTDGIWTAFSPFIGDGLTNRSTAFDRIFIDGFDQKWIVVRDENDFNRTRGLLIVDTGATNVDGDENFQFVDEKGGAGQGLPSTRVTSVTEDRDGLVWIGTESGPAYYVNTGIVAQDPSAKAIWPQWADRTLGTFMLFGLTINDISVDPANRLWFATNDGAWLVQAVEGGYEPVRHFTVDNSPLFSDNILSVSVDSRTGRVFFSTDRGLLSFDGEAIEPSPRVRDLFVYPNPVRISGAAPVEVFIEGLVEETDVRILTATGSLVRRISARGGRIRWDGRNEDGNLVSSGVYLVVAVGRNDEGTAHGRIAVIR